MLLETKDTLLLGQSQERLNDDIKAPAVSGAESYKTLCVAAKNEKKRLAEFRKRLQYRKESQQQKPSTPKGPVLTVPKPSQQCQDGTRGKRWSCYNCGEYGRSFPKRESSGKGKGPNANQSALIRVELEDSQDLGGLSC